jgi:hypothetical protein
VGTLHIGAVGARGGQFDINIDLGDAQSQPGAIPKSSQVGKYKELGKTYFNREI